MRTSGAGASSQSDSSASQRSRQSLRTARSPKGGERPASRPRRRSAIPDSRPSSHRPDPCDGTCRRQKAEEPRTQGLHEVPGDTRLRDLPRHPNRRRWSLGQWRRPATMSSRNRTAHWPSLPRMQESAEGFGHPVQGPPDSPAQQAECGPQRAIPGNDRAGPGDTPCLPSIPGRGHGEPGNSPRGAAGARSSLAATPFPAAARAGRRGAGRAAGCGHGPCRS